MTLSDVAKYPLSMRILHWVRAVLILALIVAGYSMTSMSDTTAAKFSVLYPNHKQFGVLVWIVALIQLALRQSSVIPAHPAGLKPWEQRLSSATHAAMYGLVFIVPLMGYSMSSTFTQSDGVPFFGLAVPELLPKNDHAFAVFQWLHKTLAYTLLACVVLHVAGAIKHRFFEQDRKNDVLPRML